MILISVLVVVLTFVGASIYASKKEKKAQAELMRLLEQERDKFLDDEARKEKFFVRVNLLNGAEILTDKQDSTSEIYADFSGINHIENTTSEQYAHRVVYSIIQKQAFKNKDGTYYPINQIKSLKVSNV